MMGDAGVQLRPGALFEVMAALAEEKINVEVIAVLAVLGKVVVSMVATIRPRAATALDRLAQDGISVCSCYLLADKNQLVFIVDGSERAKAIFRLWGGEQSRSRLQTQVITLAVC